MIIVVATHFVKKSKVDAFKVLAAELVEETNKEKGCMEYALYKQDGKKRTYSFIEKWEDRACLKAHSESRHIKRIGPKLQKCGRKTRTLVSYEPELLSTPCIPESVPEITTGEASIPAR